LILSDTPKKKQSRKKGESQPSTEEKESKPKPVIKECFCLSPEESVQAIHCYQEALRFYTPQAAPMAYARTQNSLGNAFLLLPGADRSAHIRSAIHCFREALRFYKPDKMPMAYAQTQHNLAMPTEFYSRGIAEKIWRGLFAVFKQPCSFSLRRLLP
jgi:hypothetical protein